MTKPPGKQGRDGVTRRSVSRALLLSGLTSATSVAGLLGASAAFARPERAVPTTLREVLNIFQLDRVAQQVLDREAYHFIVGAADDGLTKQANRIAYTETRIRPRRLVDVSRLDPSVELFGKRYPSPIILAPVGNQQQLHADGELATARAAAKREHLMIAAMLTNYSITEIAATGVGSWFQLYPSPNLEFRARLIEAAEEAGCDVLVLTIDGPGRGNHEAARWFNMHRDKDASRPSARLGNFELYEGRKGIGDPSFTWQDLAWFRQQTDMKLVLKGIVTAEDAALCRKYGVDGIIVSNHGGRQEGNGRGTLDVLPEVIDVLGGKMPVLIDGGIRRGADAFKALALGADAVCIGRPYLWGLGAFGQPGVEKCLSILQDELERTMRYAGTPTLADITPAHVWRG